MFALEHWSHYLIGKKFELETDHRPLVWLQAKKEAKGKLGRWALRLTEFDFDIRYIKGQDNSADSLSRVFMVGLPDIAAEQKTDQSLLDARSADASNYIEKDGLLYFKAAVGGRNRLCVPAKYRKQIWTSMHDDMGHLGQSKMRSLASERFFWPKMRNDMSRWAKQCRVCAVNKDFLPQPAPAPISRYRSR